MEQTEDVQAWTMFNGKITQVNIQGSIFVVRDDADTDSVKIAKDFLKTFDISKTSVLRKAGVKPVSNIVPEVETESTKKRTRIIETGERVGKINNIPIMKERLTGFYRRYPNTFTAKNMIDYFKKLYTPSDDPEALVQKSSGAVPEKSTILNKQRAHLKFLVNKGYVELISSKGNRDRVYKFREAPYGAEPAAQAEQLDVKYLIDLGNRQRSAAMDR